MMNVVLLTGPSGSGVSNVRYVLEALGYPIVENIPASLSSQLFRSFEKEGVRSGKLALLANVTAAEKLIKSAKGRDDVRLKVIVLCCKKETILDRYKITGHTHPKTAMHNISLEEAIDDEINKVLPLIESADIYVDTTSMSASELRTFLMKKLTNSESDDVTNLTFLSYSYKHGAPLGLDMSVDTSILPDPYFIEEYKNKNGLDSDIKNFILSSDVTKQYLNKLVDYLEFFIKQMQSEGRSNYNIGISSRSGQFRSPFVADYLKEYFSKLYRCEVIYRDCAELNEK